jgi:hypothetical protein
MRCEYVFRNLQRCPRTASRAVDGRPLCWRHGLQVRPVERCECEVCREVRGLGVPVGELLE